MLTGQKLHPPALSLSISRVTIVAGVERHFYSEKSECSKNFIEGTSLIWVFGVHCFIWHLESSRCRPLPPTLFACTTCHHKQFFHWLCGLFGNLNSLIWTVSYYRRFQCSRSWFKWSRCNNTVRSVRFVGFPSACYPINTWTRARNWLNYYASIRFHHSRLTYHGSFVLGSFNYVDNVRGNWTGNYIKATCLQEN